MSGATFNDDFLAQHVARVIAGSFLYHPLNRRWYRADPPNWRRDDTMLLTWRVRECLRDVSEQIGGNAHTSTLLTARRINSVEKLLRSEPTLVADPAEWQPTATGMVRR